MSNLEAGQTQPAEKRGWLPMPKSKVRPVPAQRELSGEATAGFISKLTFNWMGPIIAVSTDLDLISGTSTN